MSSATVPNPANGSFPSRSSRLSTGCQHQLILKNTNLIQQIKCLTMLVSFLETQFFLVHEMSNYLEIDRVQSAFHNECRLQMRRVDIFGWIFPVTLASLISRSPIFAWKRTNPLCGIYNVCHHMCQHSNIFCVGAHLWRNCWRYIAFVDCIPNSCCQARRKNGIDTPLALIVVLLRVSVDHLGVDQHPRQARAEGDQGVKRADCCQARLPRLCWSDLILLCWRIFGDIFSTGGCNGCLNLDNPSNFGLEDLVDELETLYQDEGYSSLISRWTLIYIEAYNLTQPCTKQGRFLGACWHCCRWQGHRERQRGLRLRRLRRSRLWPHFPMGTSSRCSGHRRF